MAGEDDLDAPDLGADPNSIAEPPRSIGHRKQSNRPAAAASPRTPPADCATRMVLGAQLSASLRESLVEQLSDLNSEEDAAAWAHRNLPAKNSLMAADAKIVEERFRVRLANIHTSNGNAFGDRPVRGKADDLVESPPAPISPPRVLTILGPDSPRDGKATRRLKRQSRSNVANGLGKSVRLRDKEHCRFLLRQPCLVCGRVPSDPHHLTFTQPRAMGRRVSDEFTVPVCRVHHRELHRSGDEAGWWRRLAIDPLPVALRLWQQTRTDAISPITQAMKPPDASARDQSRTRMTPEARPEPQPTTEGPPSDRASEMPI